MKKRTKIICTLGPASESVEAITKMVKAGMDIARLNLSHGTHESHARLITNIRKVRKELNIPLPIMWDVQGPKIRVSELEKPVEIKAGQKVVIGKDFNMDFDVSKDVKKGHRVMIQDGLLELVVDKVIGSNIHCTVRNGGLVKSHKSMNFPDTRMTMPIMTDKDMDDCKFGLTFDVDYVALSFVRDAEDIRNWTAFIKKHNPKRFALPQTIIKLELPSALDDFDNILKEVDIVMVARGDLGVEIPASRVPVVQKTIARKCLQAAKPVIVATQMLESMIDNPRPTRAEVSDVANAVIDHADAVMLSGETAYGKYPLEAVTVMANTIVDVESSEYAGERCLFVGDREGDKAAAVAAAACELSRGVEGQAIISATDSGYTARFLSHQRPIPPVYMLTDKPKIYRQMTMLWGVEPVLSKRHKNTLALLENGVDEIKAAGFIKAKDKVVVVAGNPLGARVNMLEVKTVK